mmetsp:Transcript_39785/g.89299  ORF Transcript_39785/g.89299 Transcript_39785/m.89299 type:complete len:830 (+) Transcript_39785:55-2544(+)
MAHVAPASVLGDFLVRKHGSLLRGWRTLDPSGLGSLSFQDFCRVCSDAGVCGNMVDLWRSVATPDRAGSQGVEQLSLAELDPDLELAYRSWCEHVKGRFRGGMKTFAEIAKASSRQSEDTPSAALTARGPSSVDFHDFVDGCSALGIPMPDNGGLQSELFSGLDVRGCGALSEEDFMFLQPAPSSHSKGGSKKHANKSTARFVVHDPRLGEMTKWTNLETKQQRILSRAKVEASKDLAVFRSRLLQEHGNFARAWRRSLDPDSSGSVVLVEFLQACRRINFTGNLHRLWKLLDSDGSGTMSLSELDAPTAVVLSRFRMWAWQLAGSCGEVFALFCGIRNDTTPDLPPGFHPRSPRLPLRSILPSWATTLPLAARRATVRARFGQANKRPAPCHWAPQHAQDGFLTLDAFCACLGAFEYQDPTGVSSAQIFDLLDYSSVRILTLEDFQFLDRWSPPAWMTVPGDPEATERFFEACERRYDNRVVAWRRLFDRDQSNFVSYKEFVEACDELKFNHNLPGVWANIDDDMSGYLTLREIDGVADASLAIFKTWCEVNFGGISGAFDALDADGNASLTYREFQAAALRLNLRADVEALMRYFDADNTGQITREDVLFLEDWHTKVAFGAAGGDDAPQQAVADSLQVVHEEAESILHRMYRAPRGFPSSKRGCKQTWRARCQRAKQPCLAKPRPKSECGKEAEFACLAWDSSTIVGTARKAGNKDRFTAVPGVDINDSLVREAWPKLGRPESVSESSNGQAPCRTPRARSPNWRGGHESVQSTHSAVQTPRARSTRPAPHVDPVLHGRLLLDPMHRRMLRVEGPLLGEWRPSSRG